MTKEVVKSKIDFSILRIIPKFIVIVIKYLLRLTNAVSSFTKVKKDTQLSRITKTIHMKASPAAAATSHPSDNNAPDSFRSKLFTVALIRRLLALRRLYGLFPGFTKMKFPKVKLILCFVEDFLS